MSMIVPLHKKYPNLCDAVFSAFEAASIGLALESSHRRHLRREIITLDYPDAEDSERDASWVQKDLRSLTASILSKLQGIAGDLYIQSPKLEHQLPRAMSGSVMQSNIRRIEITVIEWMNPATLKNSLRFACCVEQVELLEVKA